MQIRGTKLCSLGLTQIRQTKDGTQFQ